MGIGNQIIEIGYSIHSITRSVYDIQQNTKFEIQIGYVKYNNSEVPVWRPYDKNNMNYDAKWQKGKWKNIYSLRMPHKKGSKYIEYNLVEYKECEITAQLPGVEIILMYEIEEYIKNKMSK